MATESDRQTAAGRKGQPIVRVRFDTGDSPEAQTGRARRGEAATTVRFEPTPPKPAKPAAPGFVRTRMGPVLNLLTQEGRVLARDGYDMLVGNPYGGPKYPVQPEPVSQALAQGRKAPPPPEIMPVDRQSQMIAAILGSGLTVNEAATVAGILPANPGTGKPGTAKDAVLGQAAKLSQQLFASQVAQATDIAKNDPVGARAIVDKATQEHFARQAGLVGFNPVQLAQAALLDGAAEE